MSILLDALRKSEKNQHLHEVPTIHSGDQSMTDSDSLKAGPLAVLLITALFISGWFVWRQYQLPSEAGQSQHQYTKVTVAETNEAVDNSNSSDSSTAGTVDNTVNTNSSTTAAVKQVPVAGSPVVAEQTGQQASPQNPVAASANQRTRTPMESFKPPEGTAAASSPKPPVAKTSTRRNRSAGVSNNRLTVSQAETPKPPPPAAEKQERVPEEPAPISYWDLPDSVRVDVPEIKFSVLVYSNNPADRFVLINGERLSEGDSPQSNLFVKEIRRDGVVFKYRLYQFLVER